MSEIESYIPLMPVDGYKRDEMDETGETTQEHEQLNQTMIIKNHKKPPNFNHISTRD